MTTDRTSDGLVINLLNSSQFTNIVSPSNTELYLVEDDIGVSSQEVLTAIGYIPESNGNKVTSLTAQSTNNQYPSAKCVYDAIQTMGGIANMTYSTTCPAIVVSNGVASWSIEHNLGTSNLIVSLYNSLGVEIEKNVTIISNNAITIGFNSVNDVIAGSYSVVIIAGGASTNATNLANKNLTNLNDAGNVKLASMSLPSNRSITFEIGASGATYEMPSDGWICFETNGIVTSILYNQTKGYGITAYSKSGFAGNNMIPVRKNDVVLFHYDSTGTSNSLKFIYAEGATSEYSGGV